MLKDINKYSISKFKHINYVINKYKIILIILMNIIIKKYIFIFGLMNSLFNIQLL